MIMTGIARTEINDNLVKFIAKNYNPLDYSMKLMQLLSSIYPSENFEGCKKSKLHELLNDVVIKKHNGEPVLKYHLFNHFYKKKVVAAFEIKVKNSRVDFLTINGCTNSFEIKSGLDNLYKLKKQSSDYVLVFDYNYLVIDAKHLENALELVPSCFGVWSFSEDGSKTIYRDAILNKRIDPEAQLSLLTKAELLYQFKNEKGIVATIVNEYNETEINNKFKDALKRRYQTRWDFLLAHQENILPIDLQFFFNLNIEPDIIYCH